MRKLPIIGHPIGWDDLAYALGHSLDRGVEELFRQDLAGYLGQRHIYFLNSGLAAFYVILEALKKLSPRKEVILPAYTAPNLILAIQKAGLKPVLCDISLGDFNSDTEDVLRKITSDTLCVLGVHLFGIPWEGIVDLKGRLGKDVFVVEDCAQAFGVKIDNRPLGNFSDIAFYSFNRGKNLPTYEGGCIAVNSDNLAKQIEVEVSKIPNAGALHTASLAVKSLALALSFNPYFYGLLFPFISCFKDTRVADSFQVGGSSLFQAGLGHILLNKYEEPLKKRFENGTRLLSGLKGIEDIILPRISDKISPVFNRLPVVFKDEARVEAVLCRLAGAGIESSRLYLRPLHHIFDFGYNKDDFPNAVSLAKGLLTLPAHPLVKEKDMKKMIRIVKDAAIA